MNNEDKLIDTVVQSQSGMLGPDGYSLQEAIDDMSLSLESFEAVVSGILSNLVDFPKITEVGFENAGEIIEEGLRKLDLLEKELMNANIEEEYSQVIYQQIQSQRRHLNGDYI